MFTCAGGFSGLDKKADDPGAGVMLCLLAQEAFLVWTRRQMIQVLCLLAVSHLTGIQIELARLVFQVTRLISTLRYIFAF